MNRIALISGLACMLLLISGTSQAQTFANTGTTTVSVAVPTEAALAVNTMTSTLATSKSDFSNDFTGTTNITYKIRTTKTTGTGSLTVKVTTDFSPSGGPSVGTPPSSGDTLTFTCGASAPATACTGSQ